jgi:hypothetical protein
MIEYSSIPGFPGYEAGTDGSVWSCWKSAGPKLGKINTGTRQFRMKEQTVKPTERHPRNKPYHWIGLRVDGRTYQRFVHHCVLWAFVGQCPSGMECRHLSGDAGDNTLVNIEWGTKQSNWNDKRCHGTATVGEQNGFAILTDTDVVEMRQLHKNGASYAQLVAQFNTCYGNVRAIIKGRSWKHLPV